MSGDNTLAPFKSKRCGHLAPEFARSQIRSERKSLYCPIDCCAVEPTVDTIAPYCGLEIGQGVKAFG